MSAKSFGILTDITKCTGCESCVEACRKEHALPEERRWRWLRRSDDLSSARWTTIRRVRDGQALRYIRRQCRHCLDPECVSVCIVGALRKTPEGPVTYDRDLCIGCRYCMIACPWEIPRYSWEETVPYVQKCDMCYARVVERGEQPACVAACPSGATIFGPRDELLAEAHRRLTAAPDTYVQRVWGETEVGGTSVLYLSDVDLNLTDLDAGISTTAPLPVRTTRILHQMPLVFVGMATVMGGLHWIIRRREQLMHRGEAEQQESSPDEAAAEAKISGEEKSA